MGHLNDAAYFVAPAYIATFAVFCVMGLVVVRRLALWSRRARAEEEAERAEKAREGQPTD